jgi:AraC family transcriptional regulator
MLFHQFPDLQWLKNQAESNFANRQAWQGRTLLSMGWPSVVLNVKTNQTYRDNIRGPLSFFTNLSGVSQVSNGPKSAKINPGFFYISNPDQRYTLEVNNVNTETLNIHFGDHWADQVFRTLSTSPEKLLDESIFTTPIARIELHNKLYEINPSLHLLLEDLKLCGDDKLLEEEKLFSVLSHLLAEGKQLKKIESELPVVKNSTKQEIFKRLVDATDYIYSNLNQEISLDALSSISCLSKFHFLRLFKLAFEKTPHQFITEIKIKQATSLLTNTKLEVQEVAKRFGFKDSSTFSRLYFNQTGRYPSQAR